MDNFTFSYTTELYKNMVGRTRIQKKAPNNAASPEHPIIQAKKAERHKLIIQVKPIKAEVSE